MNLLRLTKVVPIRDDKYILKKWEKQGVIRVSPQNIEFVVAIDEMEGKTNITMRSGANLFVEESVEKVDALFEEATHR